MKSSTGQGGGGSFKNRKPIGEFGCCESWMVNDSTAGRHMVGLSGGPFSYLPMSLFIRLSTYLTIYPSIDLSIYLSICPSVCPFIYLSMRLSFSRFVDLSIVAVAVAVAAVVQAVVVVVVV